MQSLRQYRPERPLNRHHRGAFSNAHKPTVSSGIDRHLGSNSKVKVIIVDRSGISIEKDSQWDFGGALRTPSRHGFDGSSMDLRWL